MLFVLMYFMYIMYTLCFCTLCSYATCEWPEFYVNKDMFCSDLFSIFREIRLEIPPIDDSHEIPNRISKLTFKNSFRDTIRESNSLGPDQARQSVGPDLGPNCLQRLSAGDKKSPILSNYHCKFICDWC